MLDLSAAARHKSSLLTAGKATHVLSLIHAAHSHNVNGRDPITTTRGVVVIGVLSLLLGLYNFFLPDSAWRRAHKRSQATGPSESGRRMTRIVGVVALVIGVALLIGAALGKK